MANELMDLQTMKRQYVRATKAYYNADKPIMSDAEFDKLEDKIRKADPKWENLKKTGTAVSTKRAEIPLLHFMPSLNKAYPEQLAAFYKKKAITHVLRWLWMDKLDGTSLQLVYVKGVPTQLITRGDGIKGGDASHLIPALLQYKRIPKKIPTKATTVFRIEALMKIKTFEAKWSKAAAKRLGFAGFENIRNMVNGLFNKKQAHTALADTDLVVLGVYGQPLFDGLMTAKSWGFNTVRCSIPKGALSKEQHAQMLKRRRASSEYEMDGLVIAPVEFKLVYQSADKPKELVAFKVNDEESAAEVTVEDIIWQKTRLKRWIPKIRIKPTRMDGVTVVNATAHNALWMQERGIGPGAVVKVLRSGGVIPKIVDVVKVAKFKAPPGAYTVKGVHFIMEAHDATTIVRGIHHFMTTMGVELLAQKTIAKLYEATSAAKAGGFCSVYDYLWHADRARDGWSETHQALVACGLGKVQAGKILDELCRVFHKKVPLVKLMDASGCFEGTIGERKLLQLEDQGVKLKDMLSWKREDWSKMELKGLHGFKDKTITSSHEGVQRFKPWLRTVLPHISVNTTPAKAAAPAVTEGPLVGINISWTTYRSKEQEALVTRLGGAVVPFGAKTTVLLYDPDGKASTKVEKAGERAMVWKDFVRKYKVGRLTGYEQHA